ncbi:MAG TPA: response regulator transcription factor [Candidatus Baltobacteraceae bacterium]|jgi:DNA-binding NarL/FixJ family response regulator|nr:response regulator transcription factor [Candidatus Baltobacteraceae bacterium]
MNTDSIPTRTPDGEEVLRYAASLLARNDNELAVILHRPNLWDVTVGTLIDAGKVSKKGGIKRHLRSIPSTGDTKGTFDALLSARELQVVRLIAEGLSNKQIGANLELSDKTVKNHISHILAKLGLTARTQVAVLALRGGVC